MGETMKPRNSETSPCAYPAGGDDWQARAGNASSLVERGAGVPLDWKQRNRLKRTIPVYDHEIDNVPLVIGRLKRALKGEDARGRRHHWTYDINRHMALMKFLRLYEGIRDDRQDDDVSHGLGSSARRAAE